MTETIPGSSPFITTLTYDIKGRDSTITHPSGIVEKNTYNSYGYLSSISAGGVTRWTVTGRNALQQVTTARYGSNLNTTLNYDPHGNLTSMQTGSIHLYSYDINDITGNLMSRNNVLRYVSENFEYDNLDRLDSVYYGIAAKLDMRYDAIKGGISFKSDAGTFNYDNINKPYTMSSIDPSSGLITESMNDTVTYTSFEKVKTIAEGPFSATFLYNANDQRSRMVVMNGPNHEITRWYPTARFMKDSISGTVKKYTYILEGIKLVENMKEGKTFNITYTDYSGKGYSGGIVEIGSLWVAGVTNGLTNMAIGVLSDANGSTMDIAIWSAPGINPSGQGGNGSGNPVQIFNNVINAVDIVISAAASIVQNTKVGANFAYAISGNSRVVGFVSNTFKYAPYVGLGVTMLSGGYLSTEINPATGRPYQSWTETGTDIGANMATIIIGAKFGGWYGAGAAVLYLGLKCAANNPYEYYLPNGEINPGMQFISNKE